VLAQQQEATVHRVQAAESSAGSLSARVQTLAADLQGARAEAAALAAANRDLERDLLAAQRCVVMLWCGAARCDAVCRSAVLCVAVRCCVSQCGAVCRSAVLCVAVRCRAVLCVIHGGTNRVGAMCVHASYCLWMWLQGGCAADRPKQ
jgi:hypothetical protein